MSKGLVIVAIAILACVGCKRDGRTWKQVSKPNVLTVEYELVGLPASVRGDVRYEDYGDWGGTTARCDWTLAPNTLVYREQSWFDSKSHLAEAKKWLMGVCTATIDDREGK